MAGVFEAEYFARQYKGRAWRAPGSKPVLDRTRLRWLKKQVPRGRLLEVGTGYGAFARAAASDFTVVGVDLEPEVVDGAFQGTAVMPLAASAVGLPFMSGSFEAVVALDVLEHIPDPIDALSEFHRVLKPGGCLLMSVPNPDGFGARRKGGESFIYKDPTHCSVLSASAWKANLGNCGFQLVQSGTDTLWDPPYFARVPAKLQWAVFVGSAQLAWRLAPAFPWSLGENFVALSRKGG
jgi:SAM-dependent methyltransferase